MRAWLKQRSDINTLTAQIAKQKTDVAALELDKKRLHDPAYIQTLARLRFGWLMPGETGYRVIGADGQILSDGSSQLSDPIPGQPKNDPEWWQDAWGTVVEAGKDPTDVQAEAQKSKPTPVDKIGGKHQSPGKKHDR